MGVEPYAAYPEGIPTGGAVDPGLNEGKEYLIPCAATAGGRYKFPAEGC